MQKYSSMIARNDQAYWDIASLMKKLIFPSIRTPI